MVTEITSINLDYNNGEVNSVKIFFTSRNNGRNIHISGNLPLTGEEYKGNEAIDRLLTMIDEYIVAEINKQDDDEGGL